MFCPRVDPEAPAADGVPRCLRVRVVGCRPANSVQRHRDISTNHAEGRLVTGGAIWTSNRRQRSRRRGSSQRPQRRQPPGRHTDLAASFPQLSQPRLHRTRMVAGDGRAMLSVWRRHQGAPPRPMRAAEPDASGGWPVLAT